ncbi:MAG: hypothetical protein ACP5US_11815 [Candidatus Kryptoniota bacterium]
MRSTFGLTGEIFSIQTISEVEDDRSQSGVEESYLEPFYRSGESIF